MKELEFTISRHRAWDTPSAQQSIANAVLFSKSLSGLLFHLNITTNA
jgi:hypothetical protein